jgi:type IV pilus assembly protein PilA
MTSSTSPTLALRLIQRLKKKQAETSNAFTLVELLVVVAIVGILSAIALPNFLAQTDKAKATEAKTHMASTLKQAHAKFLEDGAAPESSNTDMNSTYGTPTDGDTKFDYEQVSWSSPVWTIKAVGNSTDSGLENKELDGCVNFNTGIVDIQTELDSSTAVSCS